MNKPIRNLLGAAALAAVAQAALAVPVPFSGTLSASDPVYQRTTTGAPPTLIGPPDTDSLYYDVYSFTVTADGSYSMGTLSASLTGGSDPADTFITLYQNSFSPSTPLDNAVEADDDDGPGRLSTLTQSLVTGTNYFLVVTSYRNGMVGDYTGQFDTVSGGGQVVLTSAIPEPSSMLLAALGLGALAVVRRKRQAKL